MRFFCEILKTKIQNKYLYKQIIINKSNNIHPNIFISYDYISYVKNISIIYQ